MNQTPDLAEASADALMGRVADEFLQSLNRGEQPQVEDYANRYPALAPVIRHVLPAMQALRSANSVSTEASEQPWSAQPALGCLGDYRILREVGRGGMGIVYEAEQISMARRVALKVLPFAAALDAKQLQRFKNEAQAAGHLQHQNIVPVHAVSCERGVHYYAMQFIDGRTLAQMIHDLRDRDQKDRPSAVKDQPTGDYVAPIAEVEAARAMSTPPVAAIPTKHLAQNAAHFRTVANLGVQAAEALEHAHQHGVVHRDIKPANMLVDVTGNLWVTDFGLAQIQSETGLTLSGDLLGTLRYMSPEQALARRGLVDHRTDIYSLGVTLYELLTLEPAFDGESRHALLKQIAFEEPPPPRRGNKTIPVELETIVLKAMAKNPAERYGTAQELAEDLRRYLADQPIRARRTTLVGHARRWCRRNPALATVSAVAALALIAFGLAYGFVLQQQFAAQKLAEEKRNTEKARAEAVRLSAKLELERGISHCEQGDAGTGMLWLAHSLKIAPEDATELRKDIRLNLARWHQHVHVLNAIWQPPEGARIRALGPEGKYVATSTKDNTVRVWEPATGKPIGEPMKHEGPVEDVYFSLDGKSMAIVSPKQTVQLRETSTGRAVGKSFRDEAPVVTIAFNPNGTRMVIARSDGRARLGETNTGKLVGAALQHSDVVRCVAYSADGKKILTGSQDFTARLWDAETGKPIGEPLRHQHFVYAVALSPDGRIAATGSNDRTVRLWDAVTGKPLSPPLEHVGSVRMLAFSPDSKALVSADNSGTARVWNTTTGKPIGDTIWHRGPIKFVAFSPDGKSVATSSWDGTVRLWGTTSARPVGAPLQHPDSVCDVCFSPDGKRIVTNCHTEGIRIWQVVTPDMPLLHSGEVSAVAISSDSKMVDPSNGTTFMTASEDKTVRLWDTASGKLLRTLQHPGPVWGAAFNPKGKTLVTTGEDRALRVWDLDAGKMIATPLKDRQRKESVVFSPDGKTLLIHRDSTGMLYEAETFKQTGGPLWSGESWFYCGAFSPDGKTLVTGGGDGTVRWWDVASLKPYSYKEENIGKSKPFRTVAHSPRAPVCAVAFSPDGKTMVTGSFDGTARLWEAATGKPIGTPLRHQGWVVSVAFGHDSKTVVTGSQDGTARLWKVPDAVQGDSEQIVLWTQAITNRELDDAGQIHVVDGPTWRKRRQRLEELGGPPVTSPEK